MSYDAVMPNQTPSVLNWMTDASRALAQSILKGAASAVGVVPVVGSILAGSLNFFSNLIEKDREKQENRFKNKAEQQRAIDSLSPPPLLREAAPASAALQRADTQASELSAEDRYKQGLAAYDATQQPQELTSASSDGLGLEGLSPEDREHALALTPNNSSGR